VGVDLGRDVPEEGAKFGEQGLVLCRQRLAHPVEVTWP
jgi:hypothetical protein